MSAPVIPFPERGAIRPIPAAIVDGRRADRSEIIAALVGAVAILAEVNDPIGRAYRLGLVTRIRSILGRERAALGVL